MSDVSPDTMSTDICLEVIKKSLDTDEDYVMTKWTREKDVSGAGGVLFGEPDILHVDVKLQPSKIEHHLTFWIKEPGNFIKPVQNMNAFFKETHLYSGLLSNFSDYIKPSRKLFPQSFYIVPDKILIVEDLARLGYVRKGTFDNYDAAHCDIGLETLAKFHAVSFICEASKGEPIEKMIPHLNFETVFSLDTNHQGFHFLCSSISTIENIIDAYFSHIPQEICDKALNLIKNLPGRIGLSAHKQVLCVCNTLNSNFMFKTTQEGDKVQSACLTNFTMARTSTPAFDVLQFIYLNAFGSVREEESLLVHYYNVLSRELAEADIDVKTLLTWKQFKHSLEDAKPLALCTAVLLSHFALLPKDVIDPDKTSPQDLESFILDDRSKLVLDAMRTHDSYRKRVSHIIWDLLEYAKNH